MTRPIAVLALTLALVGGCNKSSSPTSPSPPPTPTPTPTPMPPPINRYTVVGVVSNTVTNAAVGGVTVTATSSATSTNVSGTTDGNGFYSLPGIGQGTVDFRFTAPRFNPQTTRPTIGGDARQDIRLVPFFSRTGVGNTVFDMPTNVSRVRIIGTYTGGSSNFIVWIGGRLAVNEIIGTRWPSTRYEGLHLTSGGIVEITSSDGVLWEFSQEQ